MVADEYPWPPRTGYRQRLDCVLRTLATEADVDFLAVLPAERATPPPPPDVRLARHAVVVAGARPEPRTRRLGRWLVGAQPRALVWRDWSGCRAALAGWPGGWDLAWFSHAPAFVGLADLVDAPHVVDLDNLESSALRHRLRTRTARPTALAHAAADGLDARRWRRIEQAAAEQTAAVIVCSGVDRDRLGAANARIVPNGYELAESPAPRAPSGRPVLLMVGLLTYEANRDAAAYVADRVLPLIRRRLPDAQLRIVGRYDREAEVASLRGRPGVVVTGELADLGSELAAADVAVVPIRFGGGTRIKILEAFAHRIPVVTTTVGCEGLDVQAGRHLLVADDAAAFADACVALCRDAGLREQLTGAAHDLWAERYRWSAIAPTIRAIAAGAARP